ncbi:MULTISPECIES: carbohydrate ABC transporter permease [unclassified Rhizobium]|uniref:carbohydrate ABC transporter permease n=1 Tax=unclassified Rhizobium TaxID=2613769 RepID=UPI001ADAEB52|nr:MULTISPECIES: sugar ABC transporter permease [unclassified Rhizobium]MBO9127749.1 sugar ABC transporter permease [Rhizobium sp. 16-488-2b]MBO9178211.1 sugar ABC transporter permease [Rhizobium sp. 16-488-2a]
MTAVGMSSEKKVWRESARLRALKDLSTPALLLAPSVILLLIVIVVPMVQGLYFSFTNGSLMKAGHWVGLENYVKLLSSAAFWNSLRFSAIFAVCNIAGCYVLGLGIALLMQKDMPARGLFRVLLLLPWIVPSLVSIVSWRWLVMDDKALFNQIIGVFGGSPIFFLSDSTWTITIVVLIKIWRSFPFMMLSLLAALQSIDRSLYEAAAIDGATKWLMECHATADQEHLDRSLFADDDLVGQRLRYALAACPRWTR